MLSLDAEIEDWTEFSQITPRGVLETNVRTSEVFAQQEDDVSVSGKFFRIKVARNPRWFLAGGDLGSVIERHCPELQVVSAGRIFSLMPPLRDYEVVVKVPQHMSREDVGQLLFTVLGRRRSEACADKPDLADRPARMRQIQFQLMASSRWGIVNFGGGSLGRVRYRSCPARLGHTNEHAHDL